MDNLRTQEREAELAADLERDEEEAEELGCSDCTSWAPLCSDECKCSCHDRREDREGGEDAWLDGHMEAMLSGGYGDFE